MTDDRRSETRSDPRVVRTRARALVAGQRLVVEEGLDAVTLQRVAETSGVGRRTLYRHWPDRRSLLHDVLALTEAPPPPVGVDLATRLLAHLRALHAALTDGPLAYVLAALYERAVHDPEFEALRAELSSTGCAALESVLTAAVRSRELPATLDVELAIALLEGPVVHAAIVRRRSMTDAQLDAVVRGLLASPPRRAPSRRRR